jgi:hypothetical protein
MKNNNNIFNIKTVLFLCLSVMMFNACSKDDEQTYEKTRLFRPVLNVDLFSINNTIIVDMGNLKNAIGYTIEVSRDTFATIEYTVQSDVSYVELNENNLGEELFWNTLYQVRATAHAEDPQYDSRPSDLGSVRTNRFPTILNIPEVFDVTDVAARVTWTPIGAPVTSMKVFDATDLKLRTPLFPETAVSSQENTDGEAFISGLSPESNYQIAIYSDGVLRGWVNYNTKVADIDPNSPGVIDIRADESPSAVANAVSSAPDGAIILVKRGITYDLPSTSLDNKSITIRAAYGFGEQQAKLYTTGNWNIASGSNIDHIRFIDLEIRGADYGGDYVFNPSSGNTNVNEILFDNCKIGTFRGIMRLRGSNAKVTTFEIRNSIVDSLGGYGIFTCDTDENASKTSARVDNFKFTNSTFNKITIGIVSRTPSESVIIESCTFANINTIFRYRGGAENSDVANGIQIKNSIFGRKWDTTGSATTFDVVGTESGGLANTAFDVGNTFTTSDLTWVLGKELSAIILGNYSKTQEELWVDTANNNFNFKDTGFSGRFDTGDPRWRVKL